MFHPGRATHIHKFHQRPVAFLCSLDSPSSHLVHGEVANHLAVLEQMGWVQEMEMAEERGEQQPQIYLLHELV